jgi:hypothetical protein
MICPHCHQDAPSILRGVRAYCTACGAPRSLATVGEAVNVAGQPARVGGGVASVLGLIALAVGALLAFVLGTVAGLVFSMAAALWVAGGVGFFTLLVALPLLFGGRRLSQAGVDRSRAAHEHATFALAARHRGVLTVREVARAVSIREEEADALLTDLARRPDGRVTLEVDDDGALSYVFHDLRPFKAAPARVRVVEPPRIIDAELIDEEEDARVRPIVRQVSR